MYVCKQLTGSAETRVHMRLMTLITWKEIPLAHILVHIYNTYIAYKGKSICSLAEFSFCLAQMNLFTCLSVYLHLHIFDSWIGTCSAELWNRSFNGNCKCIFMNIFTYFWCALCQRAYCLWFFFSFVTTYSFTEKLPRWCDVFEFNFPPIILLRFRFAAFYHFFVYSMPPVLLFKIPTGWGLHV